MECFLFCCVYCYQMILPMGTTKLLCTVLLQSLGCTLYALAYLEAPFEKVYQTGGSIALAAMAGKINFAEGAG